MLTFERKKNLEIEIDEVFKDYSGNQQFLERFEELFHTKLELNDGQPICYTEEEIQYALSYFKQRKELCLN